MDGSAVKVLSKAQDMSNGEEPLATLGVLATLIYLGQRVARWPTLLSTPSMLPVQTRLSIEKNYLPLVLSFLIQFCLRDHCVVEVAVPKIPLDPFPRMETGHQNTFQCRTASLIPKAPVRDAMTWVGTTVVTKGISRNRVNEWFLHHLIQGVGSSPSLILATFENQTLSRLGGVLVVFSGWVKRSAC